MRFHCLGVGSIGTLFAFHLRRAARPPHAISLIVRADKFGPNPPTDHKLTIERDGIRRSAAHFDLEIFQKSTQNLYNLLYDKNGTLRIPGSPSETHTSFPQNSTSKHTPRPFLPGETIAPGDRIDSLIVTTKATTTLAAIAQVRSRLTPNSTILLCQNGMGIYETLVRGVFSDPLERPNFILASTTHGAWTKNVFDVVHASAGTISMGIVPDPLGRRDFERSRANTGSLSLDDILTPSPDEKLETTTSPTKFETLGATMRMFLSMSDLSPKWVPISHLQNILLNKLVVNSCINPLTALMQCRNGQLFGNPSAHRLLRSVCTEAAMVLKARWEDLSREGQGPTYAPPPTAIALEIEVLRVARRTAQNWSSMYWDVKAGKWTEIEFMNGYLSRLGRQYGIQTPCNDTLLELIRLRRALPPPP